MTTHCVECGEPTRFGKPFGEAHSYTPIGQPVGRPAAWCCLCEAAGHDASDCGFLRDLTPYPPSKRTEP